MSFIGSGGMTGPGGQRFGRTPGRLQNNYAQGVNYPNPFFDIGHTYLPATVKQLFRWCRYYFLTNPLINAVVFKLSEYPITDLIFEHESREVVTLWTDYFQDHLRMRGFQVETGLDYHTFGNCLTSVRFPFRKYLTCRGCRFAEMAKKVRQNWTFTSNEFRLTCPRCGETGPAVARDMPIKNASDISLTRWNPEDVQITYNQLSNEYTYFYDIPHGTRSDIAIGRKDVVESVPQLFLEATKQNKGVIFNKEMLFHLKRPTLAEQDRGWGIPLLLPLLKDTFYLQIMKKAQECVAPSTLLETVRGLVPASEVRVGDFVRTHLGSFKPISGRAVRPMVADRGDYAVELMVSGLRQMPSVFSNNHPMWLLRRNDVNRRKDSKEHRRSSYVLRNPDLYEFKWEDAGDVQVGDYIGYPTSRLRENTIIDVAKYADFVTTDRYIYSGVSAAAALAFEKLEDGEYVAHDNAGRVAKRRHAKGETPKRAERFLDLDEDLAYIAGWYLGDGSVGARRVDFSMGPDDDGVELQAAIERVFGGSFSCYKNEKSNGWTLSAFEAIFSEFISKWILGGSKQKRIPEEILGAPDEVVFAFLRGYLEADGYTEAKIRNSETIGVCCSNRQICYQLWSLLLSLGCISTVAERTSYDTVIRKKDGSEQFLEGGRPTFHWTVKSRSVRRLLSLMRGEPAEVVTSGKSGFFVHGYFASRVQQVQVVPCEEVISLEILDDHTFCVPGMATHNSILLEHIVPLRVLFPQAGSGSSDPYTSVNLVDWRDHVAGEIARWRYDPNYIPIMPLPLGNQVIGGDGRALLMTSEIQQWSDQLVVGCGVPREFIFGGLSFAGTNVSMRMLENAFIGYIIRQKQLIRFIMQQIAAFMDWPVATVRMKPFKMADDIQRKAYLFQLAQAGKISDTSLLADADINVDDENASMIREFDHRLEVMKKQQLAMATMQGEQQLIMSKFQAKAQKAMMEAQGAPIAAGEPGGVETPMDQNQAAQQDQAGDTPQGQQPQANPQTQAGPADPMAGTQSPLNANQKMDGQRNYSLLQMAQIQAQQLAKMPPPMRELSLMSLKQNSPEFAALVQKFLRELDGGEAGTPPGQQGPVAVDMRPLPEKSSPRRAAGSV